MDEFYNEIRKRHRVAMVKSTFETIFAIIGAYAIIKFIFMGEF